MNRPISQSHIRSSLALLLLSLLAFSAPKTFAQIVSSSYSPQLPSGMGMRASTASSPKAHTTLTPLAVDSLLQAAEASDSQLRGAFVFAEKRKVDIDLLSEATRETNGQRTVLTYGVKLPGALSLNFLFDQFQLPEDGYVTIFSANNPDLFIGPFGAENNNPDEILPTMLIAGDEVVIMVDVPSTSLSETKLHLSDVNGGFRAQPSWENTKALCSPNIVCMPQYTRDAASTVLLIVNGTIKGSGMMVNNSKNSPIPYLMTASHVLLGNFRYDLRNAPELARTVVAYFNYETPDCDGKIAPPFQQTLAGATLKTIFKPGDACLLEMHHHPPKEYKVYMAGWDRSKAPQAPYHNIHHPNGLPKRFNASYDPIIYGWPTKLDYDPNLGKGYHWWIKTWDVGTTAGGSSGSPLFDAKGRVIGGLTAGMSYCNTPHDDTFFALAYTWDKAELETQPLRYYLDNANSNSESCEGRYFYSAGETYRLWNYIPKNGNSNNIQKISSAFTSNVAPYSLLGESFTPSEQSTVLGVYTTLYLSPSVTYYHQKIPFSVYKRQGSTAKLIESNTLDLKSVVESEGFNSGEFTKKGIAARRYVMFYTPLSNTIPLAAGEELIVAFDKSQLPNGIDFLAIPKNGTHQTALGGNSNGTSWEPLFMEKLEQYTLGMGLSLQSSTEQASDEAMDADQPYAMSYFGSTLNVTSSPLNGGTDGEYEVILYTLLGQKVMEKSGSRTVQLPTSKLPVGIYVVRVIPGNGGEEYVKRVVLDAR